jgi:hypothetical protein
LENAVFSLPEGLEKMVWLIDFTGWTMANATPIKTARDSANILQNHYPERLSVAFLFNPPKVFEAFFKVQAVNMHHLSITLILRQYFFHITFELMFSQMVSGYQSIP